MNKRIALKVEKTLAEIGNQLSRLFGSLEYDCEESCLEYQMFNLRDTFYPFSLQVKSRNGLDLKEVACAPLPLLQQPLLLPVNWGQPV